VPKIQKRAVPKKLHEYDSLAKNRNESIFMAYITQQLAGLFMIHCKNKKLTMKITDFQISRRRAKRRACFS